MPTMERTPANEVHFDSDNSSFIVRQLDSVKDFQRAETFQRDIWGIKDDTEIVPKDVMIIVQKSAGLALGAFNTSGEMIGLLFGFLGRTPDNHWKHCSHMLGILPDYRHTGAAEALKLYQRDFVLKQGLDLITWTVNPLEGVNASFNFGKLGVVCRSYYRNFYGEMGDGLNHGLPSDRLEVEWWLSSPRVEKRVQNKTARVSLKQMQDSGAQFVNLLSSGPQEPILTSGAPIMLFEIPADFQTIKTLSPKNALVWIEHARAVFEPCFANGYLVSEFISESGPRERHNYFVFQRDIARILAA